MTYFQYSSPRKIYYYGESMDDLALMPTTTTIGKGPYPHALASEGSYALILTTNELKTYKLRSSGWVDITAATTGGGTGPVVPQNPETITAEELAAMWNS